jgi:hypothetical protein
MDRVPGVGFAGIKEPGNVREGGNLLWGVKQGPQLEGNPFAKFRASPVFEASRRHFAPGLTTQDRVADPQFVRLPADRARAADLRLQPDSPAVDAGIDLPTDWPDPLREADSGEPDIGALPLGAEPWSVGIDGRLSVFGP